MNNEHNQRRVFLKAGLAIPFITSLPWQSAEAAKNKSPVLELPQSIHDEVAGMYGKRRARRIVHTDRLELDMPEIGENFAVVPISVKGEQGWVKSLALFVAVIDKPLVSTCRFTEFSDLPVSMRSKIPKTSDVYLIAQTRDGLVGVKRNVKMTIGCGGG